MQTLSQAQRIQNDLIATGQASSYGSGTLSDDGALRRGKSNQNRFVVLSTGQYSGTTNIILNNKQDSHLNVCVYDTETRLMWSQRPAASLGGGNNGRIPWTTSGSGALSEGIFAYAEAANRAMLSGYNDWEIPNRRQLESIMKIGASNCLPDSTAFAGWNAGYASVWSSTTAPDNTANAYFVNFINGEIRGNGKTGSIGTVLVRYAPPKSVVQNYFLFRAENASNYLTTPTYDGSGQAIHPSVLYFPGGWNGYSYWMAFTPYKDMSSVYENPSILVSNDKTTWTVPPGLTNPVVAKPSQPLGDFNSDVNIVMSPDGSTMYMIYRVSNQSANQSLIFETHSADGVSWSTPVQMFIGTYLGVLSPSVVWDGSQYVLWSVNVDVAPYKTERRTCATINGTWSAATVTDMAVSGFNLWHLDVLLSDSIYYALIYVSEGKLYFSTSTDGLAWTTAIPVMLQGFSVSAWDHAQLYKSAWAKTTEGFDIWYSGVLGTTPHIGFTQLPMS